MPIDGAYETLEYLAEKYDILIATNGPSVAAREKLSKINCLRFVKDIFSADMIGFMKPGQTFFDAVQSKLNNYNNDEFLIIGDSLKSDVGLGMTCGFDSCWYDTGNEKLTKEYNPTMIIKKLLDLKDKL